MDDKLRSPTLTFFHFLNKNKRVSLHIYCYLKIKSITTTIVSFSRDYMFHISLWLKLAIVVKLFPPKLKHNRYLISFITHKGSLANETTTIEKYSLSSFISGNEYHLWKQNRHPLQITVCYHSLSDASECLCSSLGLLISFFNR